MIFLWNNLIACLMSKRIIYPAHVTHIAPIFGNGPARVCARAPKTSKNKYYLYNGLCEHNKNGRKMKKKTTTTTSIEPVDPIKIYVW